MAFTGLCEIAGAVGLMLRRLRRSAGRLLAVYFVCVFPANVQNALTAGQQVAGFSGLPPWYSRLRLGAQPLIIW